MGMYDKVKDEVNASTETRFLRLEDDGDSAVVAFLGEPFLRTVFWDGDKYATYDEAAKNRGAHKVVRIAQNVAVCEIDRSSGKAMMKILGVRIFEQGKRFFKSLIKMDEKFGVESRLFEIERQGSKGSNDTSYMILPVYELDADDRRTLVDLELFDLEKELDEDQPTNESPSNSGPVAEADADNLISVLKGHPDPQAAAESFCKQFGISRVRDLPQSRLKEAYRYLDEIRSDSKANPFA